MRTMEVYKLGPFSGFAFEQGYSKCYSFYVKM